MKEPRCFSMQTCANGNLFTCSSSKTSRSVGTLAVEEENVLSSDRFVWVCLCYNLLVFCIDHHAKGKRTRAKNDFYRFLMIKVGCLIGNHNKFTKWRAPHNNEEWQFMCALCWFNLQRWSNILAKEAWSNPSPKTGVWSGDEHTDWEGWLVWTCGQMFGQIWCHCPCPGTWHTRTFENIC